MRVFLFIIIFKKILSPKKDADEQGDILNQSIPSHSVTQLDEDPEKRSLEEGHISERLRGPKVKRQKTIRKSKNIPKSKAEIPAHQTSSYTSHDLLLPSNSKKLQLTPDTSKEQIIIDSPPENPKSSNNKVLKPIPIMLGPASIPYKPLLPKPSSNIPTILPTYPIQVKYDSPALHNPSLATNIQHLPSLGSNLQPIQSPLSIDIINRLNSAQPDTSKISYIQPSLMVGSNIHSVLPHHNVDIYQGHSNYLPNTLAASHNPYLSELLANKDVVDQNIIKEKLNTPQLTKSDTSIDKPGAYQFGSNLNTPSIQQRFSFDTPYNLPQTQINPRISNIQHSSTLLSNMPSNQYTSNIDQTYQPSYNPIGSSIPSYNPYSDQVTSDFPLNLNLHPSDTTNKFPYTHYSPLIKPHNPQLPEFKLDHPSKLFKHTLNETNRFPTLDFHSSTHSNIQHPSHRVSSIPFTQTEITLNTPHQYLPTHFRPLNDRSIQHSSSLSSNYPLAKSLTPQYQTHLNPSEHIQPSTSFIPSTSRFDFNLPSAQSLYNADKSYNLRNDPSRHQTISYTPHQSTYGNDIQLPQSVSLHDAKYQSQNIPSTSNYKNYNPVNLTVPRSISREETSSSSKVYDSNKGSLEQPIVLDL